LHPHLLISEGGILCPVPAEIRFWRQLQEFGRNANFWTSTAEINEFATTRYLYSYSAYVQSHNEYKSAALSVRCVRDE
jgi:uncharacterized protein (TIGR02145 family)